MWVDVALVIVAVWLLVAAGMSCAIGRAVRIAESQRASRYRLSTRGHVHHLSSRISLD